MPASSQLMGGGGRSGGALSRQKIDQHRTTAVGNARIEGPGEKQGVRNLAPASACPKGAAHESGPKT